METLRTHFAVWLVMLATFIRYPRHLLRDWFGR